MARSYTLAVLAFCVTLSISSDISPCAQINSLLAPLGPNITEITPRPTISAQLGYDCLNSVPLYKQEALDLVDQIILYLGWHSSLADLKTPPTDYGMPPVDLIGSLNAIKIKLQRDMYTNEYTFQSDLYLRIGRAYDGHLYFWPDLLTSVMAFSRDRKFALVSISEDGNALPKIYLYDDVMANRTLSAVVSIDGIEASIYLDNIHAQYCQYQDRDACYNAVLFSTSSLVDGSYGEFQGPGSDDIAVGAYIYPGSNTSLLFENGTTSILDNHAAITKSFDGVVDGPSFYEKFCRVKSTTPASSSNGTLSNTTTVNTNVLGRVLKRDTTLTSVIGYPNPVMTSSDGLIHGYYLSGSSVSNIAVLVITGFTPSSSVEFQALAENFIATARKDGKEKIILDLIGNIGGFTLSAIDLYAQFFPQTPMPDFHRLRRTEAFDLLTDIASNSTLVRDVTDPAATEEDISRYTQPFNARYELNETLGRFSSPADMLNGKVYKGHNYTSLKRFDYNSPFFTTNTTWAAGIDVTGYGARQNFTQPFPASNILIVTDGTCSSACILLSKALISAGAQSLVVGGRPNLNKAQALGGARSLQAWSFQTVWDATSRYYNLATEAEKKELDRYTLLPIQRSSYAGINLRDMIFEEEVKDGTLTSAQFVNVWADCRMFYTGEMVRDVAEVWKAAAERRWGGKKCTVGGFTDIA